MPNPTPVPLDAPTHGCMECKAPRPYTVEVRPNGNTTWRCLECLHVLHLIPGAYSTLAGLPPVDMTARDAWRQSQTWREHWPRQPLRDDGLRAGAARVYASILEDILPVEATYWRTVAEEAQARAHAAQREAEARRQAGERQREHARQEREKWRNTFTFAGSTFTLDDDLADILRQAQARQGPPVEVRAALTRMQLGYPCTFPQVKQRYRLLAQTLHPDHGGSTSAFQGLNDDYHCVAAFLTGKQRRVTL